MNRTAVRLSLIACLALCLVLPGEAMAHKKKKKKRRATTPTTQHGIGPGGVPAMRDMLLERIGALDLLVAGLDARIEELEDTVDELEGLAIDDDGDGFSENQGDCNDEIPEIYPGAIEDPMNGLDDDCDGETDEVDRVEEPGEGAS